MSMSRDEWAEVRTVLNGVKKGDCWCEAGIGRPGVTCTDACKAAQSLCQKAEALSTGEIHADTRTPIF